MSRSKKTYNQRQKRTAIFMIATLLWLTISTPFVNASMNQIAKQNTIENSGYPLSSSEEDSSNPFGNSNEEKTPGGSTIAEEFLHDHHKTDCLVASLKQYRQLENERAYIAFHGELLVPPPNAA